MTEDRFEEFVARAARGYNAPPADVPRDEMWARIDEARRFQRRARPQPRTAWVRWGMGVAAVLAVGIAIGRYAPQSAPPPVNTAEAERPAAELPYRLAAIRHLSQAEALLTSFRASDQAGDEVKRSAGDLLTTTRLMLDSPAAEDPQVRRLLEDLELVLAQISQLPAARADEKQIIEDAIENKDVLPRLRATVPSGPVRTTI